MIDFICFWWFLVKYTIVLGFSWWVLLPLEDSRFGFLLMMVSAMSYGLVIVSYFEYGDWLKVRIKFG